MTSPFKVLALAAALALLAARPGAAQQPILVSGYQEVPSEEFELNLDRPSAYAGEYHFGDSEGESTLHLTVTGDRVSGRLTYAVWQNERFEPRAVPLREGRIVGAMLLAPEWSGVFVRLGRQKGLILFRNPTNFIRAEFGAKLPWVRDEE
jgi:hypothetical protein